VWERVCVGVCVRERKREDERRYVCVCGGVCRWVCACLRVCVREREREREGAYGFVGSARVREDKHTSDKRALFMTSDYL